MRRILSSVITAAMVRLWTAPVLVATDTTIHFSSIERAGNVVSSDSVGIICGVEQGPRFVRVPGVHVGGHAAGYGENKNAESSQHV